MSNSRRRTFVVTLPPASRHTLASTLSRANPLLPRIPARAQAARWWPNWSSGRPHRQECTDRGRGNWRRRKRRTRKCWGGSNRVSLQVGHARKAKPAPAPPCDRTNALADSSILGKTNSCIQQDSILDAASCCQPRCGSHGSKRSWSTPSGRAPTANSFHEGGSHPVARDTLRAASCAPHRQGVSGSPFNCSRRAPVTSG